MIVRDHHGAHSSASRAVTCNTSGEQCNKRQCIEANDDDEHVGAIGRCTGVGNVPKDGPPGKQTADAHAITAVGDFSVLIALAALPPSQLAQDDSTGASEAAAGALLKLTFQNAANAAVALRNLAMIDANKEGILAAGGIQALVALVKHDSPVACKEAAAALGHLALQNAAYQGAIAAAGCISVLVALANNGWLGCRPEAAGALWNIAENNAANQEAIAAAGGIPVLVSLAKLATDGLLGTREAAADMLRNLAFQNTEAIAAAGSIPVLVDLAKVRPARCA